MSDYTVKIKAPGYITDWLRHDYWNADRRRVEFPRGSAPRAVLSALLRKTPAGYREPQGEEWTAVEVPTFRGVNPATYRYLSESGQTALVGACKKLFRAQLWMELSGVMGEDVQITDIIYDFMDRHGIEATETNWETIRQMYMRLRKKARTENSGEVKKH